jgi:hypothetical protein
VADQLWWLLRAGSYARKGTSQGSQYSILIAYQLDRLNDLWQKEILYWKFIVRGFYIEAQQVIYATWMLTA